MSERIAMTPAPLEPRYLTVEEFAVASRLSVRTIHRLKAAGRLPFIQPSGKGGKILIPEDALARLADPAVAPPETSSQKPNRARLSGRSPTWMAPSGRARP